MAESRATIERRIDRLIREVFKEYDKLALEHVRGNRSFDYNAFYQALVKVLRPQMQIIATNQVLQIAAEVGVHFDPVTITSVAAEWARTYTFELVTGLTDTTRTLLQDAVSAFMEAPEMTIDDLSKMIEPAFGKVRSEMIAVTETTRAYSEATNQYQQQLADAGLEMTRIWQTAADDLVCPICAPLDRMPEQDWPDGMESGPPAHVNCRCSEGLSALPVARLREKHEERQDYLIRELGAEWAGAETGGGL